MRHSDELSCQRFVVWMNGVTCDDNVRKEKKLSTADWKMLDLLHELLCV